MLHTKFQGHQSIGSGDEAFKVLPYMVMATILVVRARPFWTILILKALRAVYEILLHSAL